MRKILRWPGYRVYRSGALIATLGNVTAYQDTGLTASTAYTYTMQALDAAGNASAQSVSASATTPAAPPRQHRGAALAIFTQSNLEPVVGRLVVQTFRPLNQTDASGEDLLQTQLPCLLRPLQAIKVDVPELAALALIDLHQGVSGAGRLLGVADPGFHGPARQCGFARPQAA